MGEDRREEILRAVGTALRTHGYARLTMQDIADESSVSKAALHYHFDTKQDLLVAFLDRLYDRFTARLDAAEAAAGDDPVARLEALVECTLQPPEDDPAGFRTAVLEIQAQAPFEPAYRDRLANVDAHLEARLAAAIGAAKDRGRFPDSADPEALASFVVTAIHGAHARGVATGHPVADARRALLDYLGDLVPADATGAETG